MQENLTGLLVYEAGFELAIIFVGATLIAFIVMKILDRRMVARNYASDSRRLVNRIAVIIIYIIAIAWVFETLGVGFSYFLFESPYSKPAQFGLVVLGATVIAKIMTTGLELSAKRIGVEPSVRRTASQFINIIVYVIAIIISFTIFNVNLGGILTAGGLVTAAIVFATGQIINNLVSGLLIVTGRAFEVGDVIQIGADRGRVEKLSMRTTTILTEDGRNMIIPNMQFVTTPVINYTKVAHPDIRVTINFNVKRGSKDLPEIKSAIEDMLKKYFIYPEVSDPTLYLRNLTSTFYSFTAYVWVTKPSKIDRIADEVLYRIKTTLDEIGVEFA